MKMRIIIYILCGVDINTKCEGERNGRTPKPKQQATHKKAKTESDQLILMSSTSNFSVEFGGIVGGKPRPPYAYATFNCSITMTIHETRKTRTKSGVAVSNAFCPRDSWRTPGEECHLLCRRKKVTTLRHTLVPTFDDFSRANFRLEGRPTIDTGKPQGHG